MILLLFWCENATLLFLPSPSSIVACSAEQQLHACFHFKSTSEWWAGQVVPHKKVFWLASSSTQRNSSFKTTTDNRNKTCWTSMFTYFNRHESWAAALTSVIAIALVLCWRLARTSRETVRLRHYHNHYHYHPCTNPLYYWHILWLDKKL